VFDYGRPASLKLAVLVDRGGRELPVCAQFVGATLDQGRHVSLIRDGVGQFELVLEGETT
jgi:pyrimidine operon attenuation protein / uracil phosphoribosyltransferase